MTVCDGVTHVTCDWECELCDSMWSPRGVSAGTTGLWWGPWGYGGAVTITLTFSPACGILLTHFLLS